jgi:tetratricopeptide (TPR) repeat protein
MVHLLHLDERHEAASVGVMAEPNHQQVFISHGPESGALATSLARYLQGHGWEPSLLSVEEESGRGWQGAAEDAISAATAVVLLVEPEPSDAVRFEWSLALQAMWGSPAKRVIPVFLLGAEVPAFLRDLSSVRLTDDVDEQGFQEILQMINSDRTEEGAGASDEEQGRLMERLRQAIEALRRDVPDKEELKAHRNWLKTELDAAVAADEIEKQAVLGLSIGMIDSELGNAEEARVHLEKCLQALRSQETVNVKRLASVLVPLGDAQVELGDYDAAIKSYEEALEIERAAGEESPEVATLLEKVGVALVQLEKPAEAIDYLERGLGISRQQLGARHPRVSALELWLGLAAEASGNFEAAKRVYEQALQSREGASDEEDRVGQVMRLWGLGAALARLEEFNSAKEFLQRSLDLAEEEQDVQPRVLASICAALGDVEGSRGQQAAARQLYERAIDVYRQIDDRQGAAITRVTLGLALHDSGDLEDAKSVLLEALREGEQALGSSHPTVVSSLFVLGLIAEEQGDLQQAEKRVRQALALENQRNAPDLRRIRRLEEVLRRLSQTSVPATS